MPPSKAYLYLASFADLGLVSQDEGTGHYGLGPYAVQLGLAGIRQLSVVDVARTRLPELQLATGKSVYLSVWGNMGPVILSKFDSDLQAPVGIRVGCVLPLERSATGRIFLSFLPSHELTPVRSHHRAPKDRADEHGNDITVEVRKRGFATSDSLFYEGFAAVAAPIFDHADTLAGSITLLGLRRDMDLTPSGEMVSRLRAATTAISKELGSSTSY